MTEHALFFEYGETETDYLKSKDPCLAEAIDKIGHNSAIRNDLNSYTDI